MRPGAFSASDERLPDVLAWIQIRTTPEPRCNLAFRLRDFGGQSVALVFHRLAPTLDRGAVGRVLDLDRFAHVLAGGAIQTDLERRSTMILTSLPQTMMVCATIPAEYFMLEPVRQGSTGNPHT